jgi:polyphenol oxidase
MLLLPRWPAPLRVRALSTLRHCGTAGISLPPFDSFNLGNRHAAEGDDPRAVAANRARLVELAGLPAPPAWLRQVHGREVCHVARPPRPGADGYGEEPQADAACTASPGVVLAILSADCLPVLFCSDTGDAIAAAHAGWRGLASGVLEATVAALGRPPEQLLAWLGPAAGPAAYEVGIEVRAAFVDADAGAADAFRPTRPGHWYCDLYALARRRLAALGVSRVYGGDHCTISDPARFYSHRRDGCSGRMAGLVWIEPPAASTR